MECILGSCLPHNFQKLEGTVPICSKVGGDASTAVPACSKVGGTRPTGPIGWLRLCLSAETLRYATGWDHIIPRRSVKSKSVGHIQVMFCPGSRSKGQVKTPRCVTVRVRTEWKIMKEAVYLKGQVHLYCFIIR